MAMWNKAILTDDGRKLQTKVEAGSKLVFTKMAMGAGTPSNLATAKELADRKIDMQIASVDTSRPYTATIYGVLSNAKLDRGFTATEMGLYAQDPDVGEILYMVVTDSKPDYIPEQSSAIMQRVGIGVSFSNTEHVTVDFSGRGFITSDDAKNMINNELEKHRLKNPLDHPDRSVQSRHLEDGSVLTEKLKDYAVTAPKLGESAVTDAKIGNRTINDSFTDFKDTDVLSRHLSGLGAQVRNITGERKWSARPLINLKSAKEQIEFLKQNKLDASVVGSEAGKIPVLNSNGKWDTSLLPPMNYIPIGKIGTSYGNLATLGSGGRFDKARLPDDLVYTSDFHTSSGSDGYTTIVGGLTFQWGNYKPSYRENKTVNVSFPRKFNSQCFAVYTQISDNISSSSIGHNDWGIQVVSFSRYGFVSLTAAYTNNYDTSTSTVYYFAIGY